MVSQEVGWAEGRSARISSQRVVGEVGEGEGEGGEGDGRRGGSGGWDIRGWVVVTVSSKDRFRLFKSK